MNILLLDAETAPNTAFVWGLFKQNISPDHLLETSYVMCWSAKWYGQERVHFDSVKKTPDRKVMLSKLHTMMDRADAIVHYNGKKFDIPVLNKEFAKLGMGPPSPAKDIDLLEVCKRRFRFESNKLDAVAQQLELGSKVKHSGFQLWVDCMNLKPAAWKEMEAYNRQDVVLLEKLYKRLLPWIDKHPNHGAFEDARVCTNCGEEENVQRRGYQVTQMMKYPRYQCQACGTWFRGNKSVSPRLTERFATIPA